MKILHTADWHIGRFLHGQNLLEDQKHLLAQILEIVKSHEVDAVLVAGDIYDRAVPPKEAVVVLNEFIKELSELNIPLVMISGNHDSSERLDFASELLKKSDLFILADLKQVDQPIVLGNGQVDINIYGIPFASPEVVRDVFDVEVKTYDEAHTFLIEKITDSMSDSENNILMSHCFVDGAEESESEKTLSIGGSDRVSYEPMVDFDYVALGHLHAPQKRVKDHIRYSGSIGKYSFSEHQQKKGVTLLEFGNKGLKNIQHIDLLPQRNVRILEGSLLDLIEQGKTDPNNDDYIMVRLTDDVALLEPMAKLRAVYPNTLHLEQKKFQTDPLITPKSEQLDKDPFKLVEDFYLQSTNTELSDEQVAILSDILKEIREEA